MSRPEPPAGALPRLLLVENDFLMRRTIAAVARRLGVADFVEAATADAAMALARTIALQGAVVDLGNDAGGLTLVDKLRAANLPLLVMAPDDAALRLLLQARGVEKILVKPLRLQVILQAVRDLDAVKACRLERRDRSREAIETIGKIVFIAAPRAR